MTLTKAEITEHLVQELELSRKEAKSLIEAFFEEIRSALARGEPIKLSGFGNFAVRDKRERPGRNPRTGEECPVMALRVVTFHAGTTFKNRVQPTMEEREPASELNPEKESRRQAR